MPRCQGSHSPISLFGSVSLFVGSSFGLLIECSTLTVSISWTLENGSLLMWSSLFFVMFALMVWLSGYLHLIWVFSMLSWLTLNRSSILKPSQSLLPSNGLLTTSLSIPSFDLLSIPTTLTWSICSTHFESNLSTTPFYSLQCTSSSPHLYTCEFYMSPALRMLLPMLSPVSIMILWLPTLQVLSSWTLNPLNLYWGMRHHDFTSSPVQMTCQGSLDARALGA